MLTAAHAPPRPAHLPAARGFATVAAPAGHVGLIVGPTARTTMYQPLERWLATRSA